MRKHYLWMIVLLSVFKLNAQTYCTPTAGSSSQANYLKNAIFSDQGALYYSATAYQAYADNSSSQTVTSYPGGTVNVHLDFAGSSTKSYVWMMYSLFHPPNLWECIGSGYKAEPHFRIR